MKKSVLLLLGALLLSTSTFAYQVSLDLDILSQANDMYACGAGIQENANDSYSDGDYMTLDVADYASPGAAYTYAATSLEGEPSALGADDYVTVGGFNHRIQNVNLFLNSEGYGTSYYVDICFRSPSYVQYGAAGWYLLSHEASIGAGINPRAYSSAAGIQTTVTWECNTFDDANYFSADLPSSVAVNIASSTATDELNFHATLGAERLKSCKVRYLFEETSVGTARNLHQRTEKFRTLTKIYRRTN